MAKQQSDWHVLVVCEWRDSKMRPMARPINGTFATEAEAEAFAERCPAERPPDPHCLRETYRAVQSSKDVEWIVAKMRSIDDKLSVFGSVTNPNRGGDVGDIDLILPEFYDARDDDILACLGVYEELSAATGKLIELFVVTWADALGIAAWYHPSIGRWNFRRVFTGEDFFRNRRVMTFRQLVDEVARTAGQPYWKPGPREGLKNIGHDAETVRSE